MMGLFNALFGKSTNNVADYLTKGAVILDVRSLSEYNGEHIASAIHIALPELSNRIEDIKRLNKPVIAYCASGMRSASAASILKANGIDAINGGGIGSLKRKLG
ncbi:rhodanese-like domain-containing protein [uncultured Winogradskyella sp.]|uniref:rhodanese-like domain-containing protein n=1 Tax=uncultured Winogradskyella sp. TaxID=395353 RepID=UPI0030DA0D9C|tara:strand:- start:144201 stop:144512 length:312 start_codon:yes stop_codon:yes gene_type:complete